HATYDVVGFKEGAAHSAFPAPVTLTRSGNDPWI
ncbi:MAG: hypothetical protein JWQ13_3780, partial [Ramlibacter sp.]|nr:hypothetical protein [Ramlibacter sp.]